MAGAPIGGVAGQLALQRYGQPAMAGAQSMSPPAPQMGSGAMTTRPNVDWRMGNPRSGEGYDPMSGHYRSPGSSTQRDLTQRPDGSWVEARSQWDPVSGQYNEVASQTGPSFEQRLRGIDVDALMRKFGGTTLPHVKPPNPADRTAAEAAAFGRVKDQVGKQTRAAADDMANEMSARGISGSGIEGANMARILQTGQGQLGAERRDLATQGLARQGQIEDRNYGGDITQRGQDVTLAGQRIPQIIQLMRMYAGMY